MTAWKASGTVVGIIMSLWFAGDTHGRHVHLLDAALAQRPHALVHVGDIQPSRLLHAELAPLLEHTQFWWIYGNHDFDSDRDHDNLFESSLVDQCFHGRVVEIEGTRIAGLGGNFQGRIWMPPEAPRHATRASYVRATPRQSRWRGGLPRKVRSAIWHEDYSRLLDERADILVVHEAPSSHKHGFAAIDELARVMRASLIVHGHHHERYEATLPGGIRVLGVGLRGITSSAGDVVLEGEMDAQRAGRFNS